MWFRVLAVSPASWRLWNAKSFKNSPESRHRIEWPDRRPKHFLSELAKIASGNGHIARGHDMQADPKVRFWKGFA